MQHPMSQDLPEAPPINAIHAAPEGRSPAEGTPDTLPAQEAVSAPQSIIGDGSGDQSPSDPTPAKVRRSYPQNRRKANRTRDSYRSKDPVKRQRQLDALRIGRVQRKFKPRPLPSDAEKVEPSWAQLKGTKLTQAELQKMSIISFAKDALGLTLYPGQECLLRALYGEYMPQDLMPFYTSLTGLETYVAEDKTEALWCLGARSGKSFLSAIICLYEAVVRGPRWRERLTPGEVGYVILVATRLEQSKAVIQANCRRLAENGRIGHLIQESFSMELSFRNGITILSLPASSTAGRGLPVCTLVCDELAWYRSEGPRADAEIISSLRPRMSQFTGAKFVAVSTPAARMGSFWEMYNQGPQPKRLTARGPTTLLNPSIDKDFLEAEKRRDVDNYKREFEAEFTEALGAYFPALELDASFVLPGDVTPDTQFHYSAAVDQSGLSGQDKFALGVAHQEAGGKVVVDLVRSWNLRDGEQIIREIQGLVRPYHVNRIAIDRYGSGWVSSAFLRHGLEAFTRPLLPVIYTTTKALMLSRRLALPDVPALRVGFGRTMAAYRSSSLSIVHERTGEGHSDECDAVAAAIWLASSREADSYFGPVLRG